MSPVTFPPPLVSLFCTCREDLSLKFLVLTMAREIASEGKGYLMFGSYRI